MNLAVECVDALEQEPFIKYEPTISKNIPFNFLDKVKTTYFCSSRHVQIEGRYGVLAEKVIELFENENADRELTVVDRTRLHVGTLETDYEYSDFGGVISGQNYLNTKRIFTVYILSDGFGMKFKALSEHLKLSI